ncbi:hypothetical protein [Luethyella okanaganae]|uniref:Uncharacterized protein n=1 Tax=Luethyella okanaganae TaxID=69372 RepID=A0ABW1VGX3_9MICO
MFGIKKKTGLTAALIALFVLAGGAISANATQVTTYMDQWWSGTVGSYRTSTGVSQTIQLYGCAGGVAGSPAVTDVQMQLQRYNGLLAPISEGNIQQACGTTLNWGTRPSSVQYRYQLNGYVQGGPWQTGPFSADPVYINY